MQQLLPPKPVLHMEKTSFKYGTVLLKVMDFGIPGGQRSAEAFQGSEAPLPL